MSEFGATVAPSDTNKVIVSFKPETTTAHIETAIKEIEANGGKIIHRYDSVLRGFAAEIPDNSIQALTVDEHVDYVEADGQVSAYAFNLLNSKN
ncbi:hypothetical protein BGZ81_010822 [Podila clonocystis]|nr:hypothetical protein BGZ81_010822 [Podila clonocystis]